MPVLSNSRIRLQPLAIEDAPGYLGAAGTPEQAAEVFRWMTPPRGTMAPPEALDDAQTQIANALASRAPGERLPYAQFDVATGLLISHYRDCTC